MVPPLQLDETQPCSAIERLTACSLFSAAGLLLVALLSEGPFSPLRNPGADMWIKLIGLLFAGVFVGATIYEVTQRRRERRPRREPSDQPEHESAGQERPAP